MTTDLRTLKPSQTRKIASQLEAGEGALEFLSAVRTFLTRSSDVGHSADMVVSTARELSAAGVWAHIDAKVLSEVISDVKPTVRLKFLTGLPAVHRNAVEHHWSRTHVSGARVAAFEFKCVRLSLPAGSANPHIASTKKLLKLNIDADQFCNAYNHTTTLVKKGTPTSVVVTREEHLISFTIHHSAQIPAGRNKIASEWKASTPRGRLMSTYEIDHGRRGAKTDGRDS